MICTELQSLVALDHSYISAQLHRKILLENHAKHFDARKYFLQYS